MKVAKFTSTEAQLKIPRYSERTGVIYIRVSDPSQIENFSIETQIKHCRAYFLREKIKEVGIFIEEGQSAKTTNRDQLEKLLNFLRINKLKVDFLLVYKIDRWARSQEDFFALKSILRNCGVTLRSVTENVDDSPTGRFLEGVMSGLAELDNALKGQRVKACMATKALDGHPPGKALYGYKNNPITKRWVRDEDYFEIIQDVLLDFYNGLEIPDIVVKLKSGGKQTKGAEKSIKRDFDSKDVWKILSKSRKYAGFYDWAEHKDIAGKYETMITWEQHCIITSRLHKKPMNISYTPQKEEPLFYLNFSIGDDRGFIHCDSCGLRLRTCFSKGKMGKRYPYYFCPNKSCQNDKKSILKVDMETIFENFLKNIKPSNEYIELFEASYMEKWEREHHNYEMKKRIAREALDELEKQKESLIGMRGREEITKDEFTSEIEKLRVKIVLATSEVVENSISRSQLECMLFEAKLFLSNVELLYRELNTINKQIFITRLFPQGVVYQNGKVRTHEKCALFAYIDELQMIKNAVVLDGDPTENRTPIAGLKILCPNR
jgi:site-specific DNA recombinase